MKMMKRELLKNLIAEYENNTKNFKPITVEEIYDYIKKKDEFYIYVDSVTCEWCRLFVNYLSDYTDQNDIEYVTAIMYYSEKKDCVK